MNDILLNYIELSKEHGELLLQGSNKANKVHKKLTRLVAKISKSKDDIRKQFYVLIKDTANLSSD